MQSACALIHPLQLFSSSSSCTFQVEATANKRLKVEVKYVSFLSLLFWLLLRHGLSREQGQGLDARSKRRGLQKIHFR